MRKSGCAVIRGITFTHGTKSAEHQFDLWEGEARFWRGRRHRNRGGPCRFKRAKEVGNAIVAQSGRRVVLAGWTGLALTDGNQLAELVIPSLDEMMRVER